MNSNFNMAYVIFLVIAWEVMPASKFSAGQGWVGEKRPSRSFPSPTPVHCSLSLLTSKSRDLDFYYRYEVLEVQGKRIKSLRPENVFFRCYIILLFNSLYPTFDIKITISCLDFFS